MNEFFFFCSIIGGGTEDVKIVGLKWNVNDRGRTTPMFFGLGSLLAP
jgi:hypothetical protein